MEPAKRSVNISRALELPSRALEIRLPRPLNPRSAAGRVVVAMPYETQARGQLEAVISCFISVEWNEFVALGCPLSGRRVAKPGKFSGGRRRGLSAWLSPGPFLRRSHAPTELWCAPPPEIKAC